MKTPCSIEILQSALAGDLPADSETLLAEHLETCQACAARLDELAGGDDLCREAARLLAEDELDASVPICESWSEIDFVVEHLEPADEPDILGRLGGYDVLEVVGRGGMGVVLKGFDRSLKRCVAIKVLAPHLAQSSLARQRFAREAQAAAAVVHPHVLAIHQVQPQGRLPFLVMPLVAGQSLAERLAAQGTLELREILRVAMQAAAGLAAAHEQGLVHRDVKPANILLETGVERAVLTDFGLARAADDVALTRQGIIAGTPEYMSPEQARGEPLDGRSDLFSLGSVIYEMASGVSPFRADSTVATIHRLVDEAPRALESRNPELPPWFTAIVARLLAKNPADRFASAKELSQLLEGCLAHVQQPANVPLPAGLPRSRRRLSFRRPTFRRPTKLVIRGVLAMFTALAAGVLGLVLAADVPDISGRWSGDDWGAVELTKTSGGAYTGTYSETLGKLPGELEVKWSKVERRFNGNWHEGKDRFGQISLRLAGDEIRGAFTTDAKSKLNPGTPALADLLWTRADRPAGELAQAGGGPAPASEMESILVAAVDLHYNDEFTPEKVRFEPWPKGKLPPGAITRLDEIRGRRSAHTLLPGEPVVSGMLLAADRNASARGDGAAARGTELTIPLGQVKKLAYSPDGRLLGAADWGLANVYDAQTGELTTRLVLPEDPASRLAGESNAFCGPSLAFSPDSQLVAVGQGGRWVHLFEHSGRQIFRIEHRGATAIAFSPDGSLLATGGPSRIEVLGPDGESSEITSDSTLKLWDAKTGELKLNLNGKDGGDIHAITFSPNGQLLVSAGEKQPGDGGADEARTGDDGVHKSAVSKVEFWDTSTGEQKGEIPLGDDTVTTLAFAPDQTRLAIGRMRPMRGSVDMHSRSGSIEVFEVGGGGTKSIATEWMPGPLMFSPDGQLVGYFRNPRHFQWSDASTGKLVQGIELPARNQGDSWECFALAPAGDRVAISGRVDGKEAVRVWSLAGEPDGASPSSAALPTRNPRRLPTAATRASEILTEQPVKVVAYSPDGKTVAIGGGHGMAQLYDARSGEAKLSLALLQEAEKETVTRGGESLEKWVAGMGVSAVAFSPDSRRVAVAYAGGWANVFDVRSGRRLLQIVNPSLTAIAFSPDGSLLATGGQRLVATDDKGEVQVLSDGTLKLWDATTGELKLNVNGKDGGSVTALAFSPDGQMLASAGDWSPEAGPAGEPPVPGTRYGVEFWSPQTGKRVETYLTQNEERPPLSLAFSPDGRQLAIGVVHSNAGEITVIYPGLNINTFGIGDVLPTQVAFSPNGQFIAALINPRRIGFWASSIEDKSEFEIAAPASSKGDGWNCFAFAPDGGVVAMGGLVDGKQGVRFFDLAGHPSPTGVGEAGAGPVQGEAGKLLRRDDAAGGVVGGEFGGMVPPGGQSGLTGRFMFGGPVVLPESLRNCPEISVTTYAYAALDRGETV